MPRIIAGRYKGLQLKAPSGLKTRPSADQVKEAMFSMLESRHDLTGLNVLDCFAGSGSLGLEALSRGAQKVVLCDNELTALAAIKDNMTHLKLQDSEAIAKKLNWPGQASALKGEESFSLIICDPPYEKDFLVPLVLDALNNLQLIAFQALLLWEMSPATLLKLAELPNWTPITSRTWGKRAAVIFQANVE